MKPELTPSNLQKQLTMVEKSALLAKTIRGLSIDGVEAAKSGHPGLPLGMADVTSILWNEYMKFNPTNPNWFDRDRFVLSAGHGSMLIYSTLHLMGFDLPLSEIKNFRQLGSQTAGHPEYGHTVGVETTTGPLGQGISNAVGMAMAEASLTGRFNSDAHSVINHYTYVIASDGDLQEGIAHEACALAGHHQLGKLIVLYDDNHISIDGDTAVSFTEDVLKRYKAYGWHTLRIDGHDGKSIRAAIELAQAHTTQPTIIACRTTIGFGSPNKAGKASSHGSPLGAEECILTKNNLSIPLEPLFYIPEAIEGIRAEVVAKGKEAEAAWEDVWAQYAEANAAQAKALSDLIAGKFMGELEGVTLTFGEGKMATRAASGKVLASLVPELPALIGGSADLTGSNKTLVKGMGGFQANNRTGRYIYYGVREHGMAAIMNGMALHGGILPYSGTFFVFTDYMRPSLRMAALMGIQVIHVLTHDSIGLGEDGPTHQPVEHLASLRAMPNMVIIRPMDANETSIAWEAALRNTSGPTGLVLTRQKVATYNREAIGMASARNLLKGGYVLLEDEGFDTILIASGSEVELIVQAKEALNAQGKKVRLVSMPSTDLFDQQTADYREAVLPRAITNKVVIEAGASIAWYKYVGLDGKILGIDSFGASAPYKQLYAHFGLTVEAVVAAALA